MEQLLSCRAHSSPSYQFHAYFNIITRADNTNGRHWNYLRDCLFPPKSKQELTSNPNVVNIDQQPEIINAVARPQEFPFIYSFVPLRLKGCSLEDLIWNSLSVGYKTWNIWDRNKIISLYEAECHISTAICTRFNQFSPCC